MKKITTKIVESKVFEIGIIVIILINCLLIGVETYTSNEIISAIQKSCLGIFTFEIIIRMIASKNMKEYFSDTWNIFDFTIVLISFIPETWFENSQMISAIRVLRVFRVLRLLRAAEEIKLIVSVLVKSFSSLFYNAIFFIIFLYLFSIIGVTLFQLPDYDTADIEMQQKLDQYYEIAPNAPVCSPDPYGELAETMFTLFRILTGEDWTDLKYNLNVATDMGIIHTSKTVTNIYHIIWFILSAFLLLNLVVGAILNNYQVIMEESRVSKEKKLLEKEEEQLKSDG